MNLDLHAFQSITLEEMKDIRLMKRIDKKFVLPLSRLPDILYELRPEYYIQEIGEKRTFNYSTLYYDTCDYEMYKTHQNGKLNRLKVRTREYVESNLCFLEIKTKSNKGMTKKIRITNERPDCISYNESSLFLCSNTPYNCEILEGKLWTYYNRVTLVNKTKTERLTIDYNLSFRNEHTQKHVLLPQMAIIEIKREQSSYSPVTKTLQHMRIRPKGLSKYCLGTALTESHTKIKINKLKSKIRKIHKITPFEYE
ncbi:MAG: polyphosphate polymerase domain-containing protein [Candidatus Azobacteroides sp.]|nr:polyphosphate polymerase domain-containing protein [Candidatus Azobacteroides sp.]